MHIAIPTFDGYDELYVERAMKNIGACLTAAMPVA